MVGKVAIDREYIRKHFATILGDDIRLLDEPDGLKSLQVKIRERIRDI